MICKTIREWTIAVLKKDNFQCQYISEDGEECEKDAVEAHHVLKRRYRALKYDDENGIAFDVEHHKWAEKNPKEFKKWFKKHFPERWEKLWKKATKKSNQFSRKEQK